MLMKSQNEKAEFFRELHHGPEIGATKRVGLRQRRIFEQAAFPAITTTSAEIAFSLGYYDGQRIPPDLMLATVARICAAVPLAVTADLESGYSDAAKTTTGLIAAGAVGLNIEDVDHDSQGLIPTSANRKNRDDSASPPESAST